MNYKKISIGVLFFSVLFSYGQDTINNEKKIEDVVLIGTRNKKRTVVNSAVPVDVIEVKQLSQSTGQVEINQLLQFSAPSFNSNKQSGSDGSDAVDPASLRGLGPDQTLLLINGKRYHQSSLVNLFGTRGRGNTGSDLNTIPVAAIKRIEVLRDGASAQYGSDAIAGVINVVLNDRNKGTEVNAFYGLNVFKSPGNNDVVSDRKFDGNILDVSLNTGTTIGKKGGFVNLTFDFFNKDYAIRNANPDKYSASRQRYGDAAAKNMYAFINAEIPLSEKVKFYNNSGFSYRNTKSYAWTRSADADGNILEVYPNGFNPIEDTKITDFTFNNGLKFKLGSWDLDFYNAFGSNNFRYDITNTINATLGASSPTAFNAGGHALLQNTTGINATKSYDILEGLNIALGTEYRYEKFNINKGEESSYAAYDINGNIVTASTPQNLLVLNPATGNVRPGGSQGFPGYSTDLGKSRTNYAAYIDAELDVTKSWMISGAARYENYSDFGSTLNGKFATRYAFTPEFALRGSVSTGFRAPSLVQKYYSLQFTNFQEKDLVTIQLGSNDSALAKNAGISNLTEEKSVNASAGFTYNKGKFTATVDGYMVNVKDRIVLTGYFSEAEIPSLPVTFAQFFANAVDTKTKGVDIILTYAENIGSGKLTTTLAGNFNDMKISKVNAPSSLAGLESIFLSEREKAFILASSPKSKINLNLNYKINKLTTNLQLVRFDKVRLIGYGGDQDYQDYGAKVTTDFSLGYDFSSKFSWVIGGKNIFNRYPTLQYAHVSDGNTESGGIFDPVQMGFAGRQIYTMLTYKF